ncbi:trigger factor [Zavarzinia compransoris]|uniref:Trigger factor n=1 Tax=Zavarzinia compransoris TaxID=1264899 RepID=A0A317ECL7_9PROT|nr:trigger factor [Zavarzinia compransoris]PWR23870.1 trigger factor [Zavarzinia compransoris]TDP48110.1 trigger factor [Zavarzinia compransoris]
MNVTETAADGLKREFLISIGAAAIDAEVQVKIKDLSTKIRMPGFRPGKVPVSLVAKTHGDAVLGEVLQQKVNESIQSTLTEKNLRPATEPKVDVTKAGKGEDLEFKLSLEVLPEIEPADVKDIALEKLVAPVSDEEVDTMLKGFADNRKNFVAEEGRVAKAGDALTINFVGRVDGDVFEGGSADGVDLEIGSGRFIPGFEDQLVGSKAGDIVKVNVTFPADYGAKELAGKDAVFDVEVKEVKVSAEIVIDDEFAKGFGLDDLEALKAALREQIERQHGQLTRQRLKRDLLDALAARHDFPVPDSLVEIEIQQIARQLSETPEGEELTDEKKAEFREIAIRRVRLGLLLAEVGRRANVQVKAEEVNRAIMEEARRWPGQERQVIEFFRSNEQAQAQLRAPIYEDKVVDLLLEQAQTTEREVSLDELQKDPDEETEAAA